MVPWRIIITVRRQRLQTQLNPRCFGNIWLVGQQNPSSRSKTKMDDSLPRDGISKTPEVRVADRRTMIKRAAAAVGCTVLFPLRRPSDQSPILRSFRRRSNTAASCRPAGTKTAVGEPSTSHLTPQDFPVAVHSRCQDVRRSTTRRNSCEFRYQSQARSLRHLGAR